MLQFFIGTHFTVKFLYICTELYGQHGEYPDKHPYIVLKLSFPDDFINV